MSFGSLDDSPTIDGSNVPSFGAIDNSYWDHIFMRGIPKEWSDQVRQPSRSHALAASLIHRQQLRTWLGLTWVSWAGCLQKRSMTRRLTRDPAAQHLLLELVFNAWAQAAVSVIIANQENGHPEVSLRASIGAETVAKIPNGTALDILDEQPGDLEWGIIRVRYGNNKGWVRKADTVSQLRSPSASSAPCCRSSDASPRRGKSSDSWQHDVMRLGAEFAGVPKDTLNKAGLGTKSGSRVRRCAESKDSQQRSSGRCVLVRVGDSLREFFRRSKGDQELKNISVPDHMPQTEADANKSTSCALVTRRDALSDDDFSFMENANSPTLMDDLMVSMVSFDIDVSEVSFGDRHFDKHINAQMPSNADIAQPLCDELDLSCNHGGMSPLINAFRRRDDDCVKSTFADKVHLASLPGSPLHDNSLTHYTGSEVAAALKAASIASSVAQDRVMTADFQRDEALMADVARLRSDLEKLRLQMKTQQREAVT